MEVTLETKVPSGDNNGDIPICDYLGPLTEDKSTKVKAEYEDVPDILCGQELSYFENQEMTDSYANEFENQKLNFM